MSKKSLFLTLLVSIIDLLTIFPCLLLLPKFYGFTLANEVNSSKLIANS